MRLKSIIFTNSFCVIWEWQNYLIVRKKFWWFGTSGCSASALFQSVSNLPGCVIVFVEDAFIAACFWVKNLCKKFLVIWDWRLLLLRILPPTFPSQSPANCPFRPNLLSTIVSSIHSNSNWNLLLQSYFSSNIGKSSPGEETVCSQLFTGFLSAHRFLQNVFVQLRKCICPNLKDICPNY